jgi:hypothetical protein
MAIFLPERMYQENPLQNGNKIYLNKSNLDFVNKSTFSFWDRIKIRLGFHSSSLEKVAKAFSFAIDQGDNYSKTIFNQITEGRSFEEIRYLVNNLSEFNYFVEKHNEKLKSIKWLCLLSELPLINKTFIQDLALLSYKLKNELIEKNISVIKPKINLEINDSKSPGLICRIYKFVKALLYATFLIFPTWIRAEFSIKKRILFNLFLIGALTSFSVIFNISYVFSATIGLAIKFSQLAYFSPPTEYFIKYKNDHLLENCKNQEIILVLEATFDKKNAFEARFPIELEKNYPIAFRKISSIHDINKAFKEAFLNGNTIKHLVIRGHGKPTSILLGKNCYLSTQNAPLIASNLKKIEENGFIILHSCSTGKDGINNIAKTLSTYAPSRRVVAPTEKTNSLWTISNDPIKITFRNYDLEDITAIFTSKKMKPINSSSYHYPVIEMIEIENKNYDITNPSNIKKIQTENLV